MVICFIADREMAKRKEVSRRELEARRERHYIEKEKHRMLKEIVKKHKLDQRREKKDIVMVSDNSDKDESEDSDESSDSTDSEEKRTGNLEFNSINNKIIINQLPFS